MSSLSPPSPVLRVLVADDDPTLLRLLGLWLSSAGYEVAFATDGEAAWTQVLTCCPDVLITDWHMPRLDGPELCRRMRAGPLPHYVYVIFLTGDTARDKLVAGLEEGADDFLIKPVARGELLARLQAASRLIGLERQLREAARTDTLTGLLTRRSFHEALRVEWERSRRYHLPLTCVMVDVDYFKRINDIHGHATGDALLQGVAELLRRSTRASDTIGRFGGEEFCLLLPETDEQQGLLWAERTRQALAQTLFPLGAESIRVTASFGVGQRRDDTQTCEQLIDLADQALLCAKQSGRDRVVGYQSLGGAGALELQCEREGLFRGVVARHVMTSIVAGLREDATVGAAAEILLRTRTNSAPVIDAEGRLVGILSEKDLMAALVSLECWQRPVREVMRPNVITYDEETPIRVIYEFLCRVAIRRVVIVREGRPQGTISRGTLLRWFRNLILSKGLVRDADSFGIAAPAEPGEARRRLAETARELARQATSLEACFAEDLPDLAPHVVGGATRMETLVTDLLAYSRYANEGAEGLASLQPSSPA